MSEFEDLIIDDAAWWTDWATTLRLLAGNDARQGALWPVDDYLGRPRYVACPRRGTHFTLGECWMCWCDVAWGHATREQVLRRESAEG